MRRLARWARAGTVGGLVLAIETAGCGGPEFVAGTGTEDAAPGADASGEDATLPAEGGARPDASPPRDGAPEPSDAGDAGDVTKMGSDGGDAAPSPGDGGDGGPSPFACPSSDPTVVFCSAFDKQATPPWDWASDPVTAKGSDAVDTVDFISPPNAYAASNKALLVTDTAQIASLGKPFSSLALHIDYVFHLFVKQYDGLTNPPIPVAQLTVGPTTAAAFSLDLVLKGGQLSLEQLFTGTDGGQQTTSTAVGAVGSGVWVKVELLLDRSATNWTAAVSLDGVSKLTAQTVMTPSNQNLEVDLGILEVLPPAGANTVAFDDVTVRAY